MLNKLEYIKDEKGEFQPPSGGVWSDVAQQWIYPYFPSDSLIEAVNLAIRLNRCLLLEGEPGCGKSQLAAAIFYQFSQRYPETQWRYRLWNVQSTSKAQDGFYCYDYVGRLQAAQLAKENVKNLRNASKEGEEGSHSQEMIDPSDPEQFIDWGPLGHAFREKDCRTIVLVDEIDKADRDVPNDLLLAIEQQKFEVKGVRPPRWEFADKDAPPIILITSNREQELPSAFLRRCLYHYVDFPDEATLTQIINARFKEPPDEIISAALTKFLELRAAMEDEKGDLGKKVSTSELIDWFAAVCDNDPDSIKKNTETIKARLEQKELYGASVLLKGHQDYNQFRE